MVIATIIIGVVAISLLVANAPVAAKWVVGIFVTGVILWVSIGMVKDILRGRWGLDILAVLAMTATLATGEYAAALIVSLMLTGGEALEDYAEHRARRELTTLLDQSPEVAHRIDPMTEITQEVPIDDVTPGDILLIRPGQIVPVDVIIRDGSAEIDTSSLTGESLPVTFTKGEEIPSGALNTQVAFTASTLRPASESQYQRIISLVQQAQSSRAPIVRLADRFAVPFTVFSLLLAGAAWWISGESIRLAQVLVLATPCPLLIAAPVAFLGGLSQSAKNGVIVKGGSVLESLSRIRTAAFDKTGTLTQGHPTVIGVHPEPGISKGELLRLAASAEQFSTHVFAHGVLAAAESRNLPLSLGTKATETATNGIQATIEGAVVRVGKEAFITDAVNHAVGSPPLLPGQAAAFVSINDSFIGSLTLTDPIRMESAAVISWLNTHGIRSLMVTGDSTHTAQTVAVDVGIDTVHTGLLPEDKVQIVRGLPGPTLMVGDGINDAPVLAVADVGIAMGARGATAAGEAADAVVLRDDLSAVIDTVRIARYTISVALTAIWIGIGLSIGLMLIAATGVIPAVIGAFFQEVVDVTAILYALRARRVQQVT